MTMRPWMPLYVADYLADTAHLNATESGAYLHLIMHYWLNAGLPQEDRHLARIARLTDRQWDGARATIAAFFHDGWHHKRIDAELARAADISSKRRASVQQRHNKTTTLDPTNVDQLNTHARASSPSQSQPQSSEAYASAPPALEPDLVDVVDEEPRARLWRLGKPILISFGISEKRTGTLIGQWLKAKPDPLGLLAVLQFARDQNVSEPVAYVSTIMHGKSKNGAVNDFDRRPGESLGDLAERMAAEAREFERTAGAQRPDDNFGRH